MGSPGYEKGYGLRVNTSQQNGLLRIAIWGLYEKFTHSILNIHVYKLHLESVNNLNFGDFFNLRVPVPWMCAESGSNDIIARARELLTANEWTQGSLPAINHRPVRADMSFPCLWLPQAWICLFWRAGSAGGYRFFWVPVPGEYHLIIFPSCTVIFASF